MRGRAPCPPRSRVVAGEVAHRARRRGAGGDRHARGRRQVRRARPRASSRARRTGATTVAATVAPRGSRRHRRVRHRRPRRRAPRGARELGRVGRPRLARADPDHRRLRGREVDPRRRRHARAPGDAQRDAARATAPTRSRASTSPTRASRCRGGSTRPEEVAAVCARAPRLGTTAAIVVANPLPDEQLDPELHDRVLAARARGGRGERASTGKDIDAVPARLLPPRDATARASRSTSGSCCATPRWPRGSRAAA